jgi:hypothetical protein
MSKRLDPEEILPDDPRPPYSNWTDYLLGFDMHGVTPSLEIKGKRKYKTWLGASFSFLAVVVMVVYSL